MRQINQNGLKLIEGFEGCYLEAYPDPASKLARACKAAKISIYHEHYKQFPGWEKLSGTPWTIGFGRTRHEDGTPIKPGEKITMAEALPDLLHDMQSEGSHFVDAWVKVPLTDDQYAALTSFVYNAGCGTFHSSPILPLLNQGRMREAADAMLPYDTAQGVRLRGLDRRRDAEHALFLSDIPQMEKDLAG